jgi:hypothetical protein
MTFPDSISTWARRFALVLAAIGVACAREPSEPTGARLAEPPTFAKSSTTVSLSSVSPDTASLSTTIDVTMAGSGFADGMVAVWQLNGVSDPTQVRTNSTRYVSAKQLVANITISGSATSASWDVALYSGGKTGIGTEVAVLKQAFKVLDPTATWIIPLDDAGLGFRSDHLYSDGVNSLYADGVCKVTAVIYATSNASGSGDAIFSTNVSSGKCVRRFTLAYPDGFTETVGSFNNLSLIENATYSIPIGATVERQLHVSPATLVGNNPSRCGGLIFGYGVMSNIAAASDSLLVTRESANTWHVVSQPPPHTMAYCKSTGQYFSMPVDFTIVTNRPLP